MTKKVCLKDTLKNTIKSDTEIDIIAFPVKYPQGAEKQLIKAALKREVPSGGLPMDIGVVVHNVGTARAIYDAVALEKPLTVIVRRCASSLTLPMLVCVASL